jgi:hypothetical protein
MRPDDLGSRTVVLLNRMSSITPLRDARVLRQIDAAVTELRRGGFVLLQEAEMALIAQAAETVSGESLARLKALSGHRVSLVLTRRRAAALGGGEKV